MNNIRVIGFDADDTLWVNEPNYKEAESEFCELLSDYMTAEEIGRELFRIEMQNLDLYGFGAKGFLLSLIETSLSASAGKVDSETLSKIILIGKKLIEKDVELLDGTVDVLEELSNKEYRLIVATKGDLLDQERKLKKSGIEKYFHHVEVMSDKKEEDYRKLLAHLDIRPENFLMIGNSLKSDIIPVLNIGGKAIHIPYHTNWDYEKDVEPGKDHRYHTVDYLTRILKIIQ